METTRPAYIAHARDIALFLGALLAAFVLAEVALRVIRPIPFSEEVEYVSDAHLGLRLTPGKSYQLRNGGTCSINAQGFRGYRDTPPVKPPGTARVVVLGGSSTFCYETDDHRTWCALLEQLLASHYGRDVEVVNAGVPGYSSFDSKVNYLYRIRPLRPDVVVVYHTWNDLKYFKAIESESWPIRSGWHPTWRRHLKSLARHSQIARRVRAFMNEVVYPKRRENVYAAGNPATTIAPGGAAHAWERLNFADIAMLLSADSVAAVFATQASLISDSTIHDPAIRKVLYIEYASMSFGEVRDEWNAVSDIIRTVAGAHNMCLADVRPAVPADLDHFVDHVHLTDRGNELLSRALFERMVKCPDVDRALRVPRH